jgi:hypothetical protein
MSRIQFQPGMTLSQFLELYGTEEQCEAALEQAPGQIDSAAPDVENKSMILCMGVATGAISAGDAVIRRQSLQERSWKPPSCRLPSGSRLSIWWGMLKQVFLHSPL